MCTEKNRICLCIDLKSFYASVECVERGLDPLKTNLVVADPERTEKTICLAVSPPLKELGVHSRCRLFEIPKNVELIIAKPQMQHYIDISAKIYGIYLKYISKEDIHVYSIDEAFFDVTDYLGMYQMTARELATRMIKDVLNETGVTAACGIGTNLYLAKIAMDITAKHMEADADGVRIGELTEEGYRETLWQHKPLTDFWRIGSGTARRLAGAGITTMEELAHADEDMLYRFFGVDAELLIDHAWGRENTLISDIKEFQPKNSSLSNGQVFGCDYSHEECLVVVKEMADMLCLELVDQGLVTDSVTLYIGYNKHLGVEGSHGTVRLPLQTSSSRMMMDYAAQLYERIETKHVPIHRVNISFNNVVDEAYQQYNLFVDPAELERENKMQRTMLDIKKKFGKNAILRGMDLTSAGTAMERNEQIGGHKA